MANTPWYVYKLRGEAGRSYIGATTNMERRLRQHNGLLKGGARSTRSDKHWVVEELRGPFANQSSALKAEYAWKHPR
jgi:predicted GIY-YIG superfamily endonuclease